MAAERNHPAEMARIALSPAHPNDTLMLERLIKDAFERLTWRWSPDRLESLLAELRVMISDDEAA